MCHHLLTPSLAIQDVRGTLVWLNGGPASKETTRDPAQRKLSMRQLFVVEDLSSGNLVLQPLLEGSVSEKICNGGMRMMKRTDAFRLQMVQTQDL